MSTDPCTVATRSHLVARALYARASAAGTVEQRGAVHVAFSGSPAASFNTAFIVEPLDAPRPEVREFVAWAATLDVPYHIYLRDGADAAAEEALRSEGCTLLDTEPWMLADPVEDDGCAVRTVDAADPTGDRRRCAPPTPHDGGRGLRDGRRARHRSVPCGPARRRAAALVHGPRRGAAGGDHGGGPCRSGARPPEHRRGRGRSPARTRHGDDPVRQRLAHQLDCAGVSLQASPMGERLHRRLGFRRLPLPPPTGSSLAPSRSSPRRCLGVQRIIIVTSTGR